VQVSFRIVVFRFYSRHERVLSRLLIDCKSFIIFEARLVSGDLALVEVKTSLSLQVVHHSLNLQVAVKSKFWANFFCSVPRSHHPSLVLRFGNRLVVNESVPVARVAKPFIVSARGSKAHHWVAFPLKVVFFSGF
jgi:hypothetical protein